MCILKFVSSLEARKIVKKISGVTHALDIKAL